MNKIFTLIILNILVINPRVLKAQESNGALAGFQSLQQRIEGLKASHAPLNLPVLSHSHLWLPPLRLAATPTIAKDASSVPPKATVGIAQKLGVALGASVAGGLTFWHVTKWLLKETAPTSRQGPHEPIGALINTASEGIRRTVAISYGLAGAALAAALLYGTVHYLFTPANRS